MCFCNGLYKFLIFIQANSQICLLLSAFIDTVLAHPFVLVSMCARVLSNKQRFLNKRLCCSCAQRSLSLHNPRSQSEWWSSSKPNQWMEHNSSIRHTTFFQHCCRSSGTCLSETLTHTHMIVIHPESLDGDRHDNCAKNTHSFYVSLRVHMFTTNV